MENESTKVLGLIPKLYWKWKFRPFYRRLDNIEGQIKNSTEPSVRHYYSVTGPARARLKTQFAKLKATPEPHRSKAILHLVGQIFMLSNSYPEWFNRACAVNQGPFTKDRQAQLALDFTWQSGRIMGLLKRLVDVYNKQNGSKYSAENFTASLPLSVGVRDLIRFHESCLKAAETQRTEESLDPLRLCHFEIDITFIRLELLLIEMKAGTAYEEYLMTLEHPRLSLDESKQAFEHMTDRACPAGSVTIDAIANIIQSSYGRAV